MHHEALAMTVVKAPVKQYRYSDKMHLLEGGEITYCGLSRSDWLEVGYRQGKLAADNHLVCVKCTMLALK